MSELRPAFYSTSLFSNQVLSAEIRWAFLEEGTDSVRSERHRVEPFKSCHESEFQGLREAQTCEPAAKVAVRSASEMVRHMNAVLRGRRLWSQSPAQDERLLFLVWEQSGVAAFETAGSQATVMVAPNFTIARLRAQVWLRRQAFKRSWSALDYEAAQQTADRRALAGQHVEADVRSLAILWQMIAIPEPTKRTTREII